MRSLLAVMGIILMTVAASAQGWQDPMDEFKHLPKEARDWATKTRNNCKEYGEVNITNLSPMAGIEKITIDGHPSVIIDDAHLCGDYRAAAVNCSNRSCALGIYKQDGKVWYKILEDDLMQNYPVLDWDVQYSAVDAGQNTPDPVFQMLVATIWAGDPRCHPTRPSVSYTSGRSCNVIGRYHNNAWQWEKVR